MKRLQIQIVCDQAEMEIADLFQIENYGVPTGTTKRLYWQTFESERDAKQHLLSVGCDNAIYEPQSHDNGRELTIRGVTAKIVTEGLV